MSHRAQSWTVWMVATCIAIAGCKSSTHSVTGVDVGAPTVVATNPIDGSVGVAVITAAFSKSMNASTINATTFTVTTASGTPVAGTVTFDNAANVATFVPTTALALNTAYRATVTTGVQDASGNAMAAAKTWTFTTASAAAIQTAPNLGASATYAVLAHTSITSAGSSQVTGDMGLTPGNSVIGFPPGTLTGALHVGDAVAATAANAAASAYTEVVGRASAPVTLSSNVSGLTLPPGLYRTTSAMALTQGNLALDAQGNPNAVFVFQTTSLAISSGRSVVLMNGARAANVFWQVAGSANVGSSANVTGTILADQTIALASGANLQGRAISRSGSVSLVSSTVVVPSVAGTLAVAGNGR